MKRIFTVLIMIFVSMNVFAQFRGLEWGTDKRDVERVNGDPDDVDNSGNLIYQGSIGGEDCWIVFGFYNDKLCTGGYFFSDVFMNKNDYIDQFGTIDELVIGRYGNPTEPNVIWKDRTYFNDSSRWGLAISMGQLELRYIWNLPSGTSIMHVLYGNNFDITHGLFYYDSATMDKLNREKKENAKSQL